MQKKQFVVGSIDDIMNEYAFDIHDIRFNVKDVIQCLFLCNATLYSSFYENQSCDSYSVIISKDTKTITIASMISTGQKYLECTFRNVPDHELDEELVKRNKYMYDTKSNTIMMLISKGYVMDNFEVANSYNDFSTSEIIDLVTMTAQDIESLTDKNPKLV